MIKLILVMMFLLLGSYSLRADDVPGDDQEFMKGLDNVKNPFEDGLPKPVIVVPELPKVIVQPPIMVTPMPPKIAEPQVVVQPPPPVELPSLTLQGVIVGEDVKEAIINDQVVPLMGTIEDAQVQAVSKEGVTLSFKGKKFFLKVD